MTEEEHLCSMASSRMIVAIANASPEDVGNDAASLAKHLVRDAYRAGRRIQRMEDEPLMKKRPTQAERRAAMAVAARVGKLQK